MTCLFRLFLIVFFVQLTIAVESFATPNTPTHFSVTAANTTGQVIIKWRDNSEGKSRFHIQRRKIVAKRPRIRNFFVARGKVKLIDSPGLGIFFYRIQSLYRGKTSTFTKWTKIVLSSGRATATPTTVAISTVATPTETPTSSATATPTITQTPTIEFTATPSPTPTQSIIVGVWYQSADTATITKWKSRGVDTYVGPPTVNGVWNIKTFLNNLAAQGMHAFVMPSDAATARNINLRPDYIGYTAPTADATYPAFLGWNIEPDEPELDTNQVGYPDNIDKASSVSLWVDRTSYLRGIAPNNFQMGNFAGAHVSYCWNYGAHDRHTSIGITWQDYQNMAAPLDLVVQDWYPITIGKPISDLVYHNNALIDLAAGKPYGVFIESSDQRLTAAGRAPTPAEFKAEVWLSLIQGASAIFYFPQAVGSYRTPAPGGNRDDNTAADVASEMITQNALIRLYEGILRAPGTYTASSPFHKRVVRMDDMSKYTFVVNLSSSAGSYEGNDYEGWEVKILVE